MSIKTQISTTFSCSLERAFKAPILGDATKFLNGYFLQPPVEKFIDDATWGQVNGLRFPFTKGNILLPSGITFTDEVLQRKENEYWQWTIYDFRAKLMFFLDHAVGEWTVEELDKNQIKVTYTYTFMPSHSLFYPFAWLFCKIQWTGMMKQAIKGIKLQAEGNGDFIYR